MAGISGVECIAIDAPGHGDSATSGVALTFDAFADAIVELLDDLGIGSTILGGISMGAGLSLAISHRYPERVSALVLVRPAWTDRPGRPHLDIVSDIGSWMIEHGATGARRRLESDERYQEMVVSEPLAAGSLARVIGQTAATGRADVLVTMVDSQPIADLADLATIEQPALVVATERDRLHPRAIADQIASGLPNATFFRAPARYLEPEAHQRSLTKAITTFINALPAANDGSDHKNDPADPDDLGVSA